MVSPVPDSTMACACISKSLIGIIEKVRDAGGALSFSDLTPVNEEVFRLMGLHRHVSIRPRQEEASERKSGAEDGRGKTEANR